MLAGAAAGAQWCLLERLQKVFVSEEKVLRQKGPKRSVEALFKLGVSGRRVRVGAEPLAFCV